MNKFVVKVEETDEYKNLLKEKQSIEEKLKSEIKENKKLRKQINKIKEQEKLDKDFQKMQEQIDLKNQKVEEQESEIKRLMKIISKN